MHYTDIPVLSLLCGQDAYCTFVCQSLPIQNGGCRILTITTFKIKISERGRHNGVNEAALSILFSLGAITYNPNNHDKS